ncbi:MAG TPA: hypothetical protein VF610_12665, partial [Segetibacter sp.]
MEFTLTSLRRTLVLFFRYEANTKVTNLSLDNYKISGMKKSLFVSPNRIQNVQECDARMFNTYSKP